MDCFLRLQALERRVDAATFERLTCEERIATEAVRYRQLEGALNEKESIIRSLRHQMSQLDAQKMIAEEAETTSLLRYLRSKLAQDEAEKKLALLEVGARKSEWVMRLPARLVMRWVSCIADLFLVY